MDEALIDDLEEADVLAAAGEDLRVTDAFSAHLEVARTRQADEEEATVRDRLLDRFADRDAAAALLDRLDGHADLLARVDALTAGAVADAETTLRQLVVLNRVLDTDVTAHDAPAQFLPVRGDHLAFYLGLHRVAVAYVWRDECPECEGMKRELDATFETYPADVGLYAVYGPAWARAVETAYNVVGGPTTLFVRDGEVDARLEGHFEQPVIESELEKTRELVDAAGD